MGFNITWVACQKPDGNAPVSKVLELGAVAHYFIGDLYYNDSGGTVDLNGVTHVTTVYGPTGNNTQARNLARFINVYGTAGLATYQELWAARAAGRIKVYSAWDDHDGCWNNNDHSLAVFKGAYNVAGGTLSGQTDASLTQADVLAQWRLGQTCLGIIQAAYFDNQWGAPNGNIPSAMAGLAVAGDYPVKYFYRDYGLDGTEGVPGGIRVIVPDCISYKDPAANVDNAGKTMLGAVQLQWIKDRISEATAAGYKHTVMLWTKDLFNFDNGDGGAGYRTEVDALMGWIHSNNHAVIHGTGDRHAPHASLSRVSSGDAYDAVVACACPFGQGSGSLTQYPRNIWALNQNDACVIGLVEVDEIQQVTVLSILDAFSLQALFSATVPWGSRLPSKISSVSTNAFRPSASPLRTLPAVPASAALYTNTLPVPVQMIISGGTVSLIEFTRDAGTTYDALGVVAGAVTLAPGDGIRLTYTVAPTKFVQLPLA